MKQAIAIAVLLLVAAASGFAEETSGRTGNENELLRMKEVEVWGNVPLRMEELEVRGLREMPEVLYLPVHRGITLPSPVRYDLFLGDMERPVFHREFLPGATQADSPFVPGSAP